MSDQAGSSPAPAPASAATHTVPSTPETVRSGFLDPAASPVASVAPGDTVRDPDTWTHWGNEAEPGDVIEVSITRLRTIGWGWNSFPLGVGALPHDFAEPYVHYFTFDEARTAA
jgi:acetamidase/formamidase